MFQFLTVYLPKQNALILKQNFVFAHSYFLGAKNHVWEIIKTDKNVFLVWLNQ